MGDFQDRLQRAVQRGAQRATAKHHAERQKALTEDELKTLHSKYRLHLSEHIETCIQQLPQHFPGFRSETIYGERGWGAACSRDDFGSGNRRRRSNFYSRLEMTVRPYSSLHVLELVAKGTVRNKEAFNRMHFQAIDDADVDNFVELIDVWVLEFAELYAASI